MEKKREPYVCKRHGQVEPNLSVRKNGYLHRRCPLCLHERFDKAEWQRNRRARASEGLGPKGRDYKPKAVNPEDLPQYRCRYHGEVEPMVSKLSTGRIQRRCSVCWKANDDPIHIANRAKQTEYMRTWSRRVKDECYGAYGNACSCCGERREEFLHIDHVNRDGHIQRKRGGPSGGTRLYAWLRSRGFPKEGFRLLCANCNLGRERNGGVCPHVSEPPVETG